MGVVVSKKTNSRTKKVQQTASVVAALKVQKSNKVESSTSHNLQSNKFYSYDRGTRNGSGEVNVMFAERRLSADKKAIESLTYGLPALKEPLDRLPSISDRGITGNLEKSNSKGREDVEIVTIPYFGAWDNRVS